MRRTRAVVSWVSTALMPAVCKVRFGASGILTSLMLVYVADLGMEYLVRGPWRDPAGLNFPTTAEFDPVATLPTLIEGSRLHVGAVLALLVVMLATALLGRTIMGFEIRLVGAAPKAARSRCTPRSSARHCATSCAQASSSGLAGRVAFCAAANCAAVKGPSTTARL